MIAQHVGMALPNRYAVRHQLAHRRLIVIVAHDAAGNTRCAGTDALFVDDENVCTRSLAKGFQVLGQMIGRTQPMNAGADDHILGPAR